MSKYSFLATCKPVNQQKPICCKKNDEKYIIQKQWQCIGTRRVSEVKLNTISWKETNEPATDRVSLIHHHQYHTIHTPRYLYLSKSKPNSLRLRATKTIDKVKIQKKFHFDYKSNIQQPTSKSFRRVSNWLLYEDYM